MIRRAIALAVALVVWSPAIVHAQDLVFTVSVPSADVYKGPSNVTPVIGHVPRGTAMPVLRDLGSWVRISWPAAPDGVAFVHVTSGRVTPPKADTPASRPSAQGPAASSAATPAPSSADGQKIVTPRPQAPRERVAVRGPEDTTAISHVVGLGGVVGTTRSAGITSRAWRDNRLGIQIGFTREAMTNDAAGTRVTSMQVEPAVVYGLYDFVSDYFWIRPYIGSGVSVRHQTLHSSAPGTVSPSDTGTGFRLFGGSEMTFAGVPRLALSVEAGYRRLPEPFEGFAADRFAVSIAGHWYVK